MGVAGLCVQCNVRHHALIHELLLHVPVQERHMLRMGQLDRQRDFHLAGQLAVRSGLDGLGLIPQCQTVEHPGRRTLGGHDGAVCDFGLTRVIEHKPRACTGEANASAVRRSLHRVAAVAARNHLRRKMKNRHALHLLPTAGNEGEGMRWHARMGRAPDVSGPSQAHTNGTFV